MMIHKTIMFQVEENEKEGDGLHRSKEERAEKWDASG